MSLTKLDALLLFFCIFLPVPCTIAQEQVAIIRHPHSIDVLIGGKPFTTYYFGPQEAKPYLQPLRTAHGTILTRGFPVGNEIPRAHWHDPNIEPHQRPMYFAHGDIDGFTFWAEKVFARFYGHEAERYGRTVFERLDAAKSGRHSGAIRARFNLVAPDDHLLGEETQSYVFQGGPDRRIIDCEFIIYASHGPIRMGDTKEGTFAIRVTKQLDSPPGHMISSNGGVGEPEIWGKRAAWVDYYGQVNGEEAGIAIFDSPHSFRHPTYWHARAYGLFAANPFGLREFTHNPSDDGSYTIPAGKSLVFRYRVFIHHGDYRQAGVAKAYQEYVASERAVP
ncbi:MAG TPA: PmoA family protein [Terriglobia bacterium]|nr:PmoA family protein [Terriglobia bacterium]